jgi:hypothetical protein
VNERVPVLLITGTVGAGKTTLAWEISTTLSELDIAHAAVDCDTLCAVHPATSTWNADVMFESLAALWRIQHAHGARRLVYAMVYEDPTDLERYREAIPGADITVVRVVASHDLRVERLKGRMAPGASLDWHLRRTGELEDILERAAYEDFTVANGDRPIRDVAVEVLQRIGWVAV